MTDGRSQSGRIQRPNDIIKEVKKLNNHNIPIHGLAFGQGAGNSSAKIIGWDCRFIVTLTS
jgi:hypothetical protein